MLFPKTSAGQVVRGSNKYQPVRVSGTATQGEGQNPPNDTYGFTHAQKPKTKQAYNNPITDFDEFIACYYKSENRSIRRETKTIDRRQCFKYEDLFARGKTNLDIFWLKDDTLEDTDNLPPPAVLAAEIFEQLEAALEEFRSAEALPGE